ncbi:MAG: amidohydrolase family protein [Bryobacteraceae bacterium]
MQRRSLLGGGPALVFAGSGTRKSPFPIIDSHVHLYDPTRPQGVPWPSEKQKNLYRKFLPADYRKIAEPFGIAGMIEMECSTWVEDNYWVLDVAAKDPVVVGTIGYLHPGTADFREHLPRLRKNPLFRGIRIRLWGRDIPGEARKPEFISDLKTLAESGLTLDVVGSASLLTDSILITDKVPELRVVIDHLPGFPVPEEAAARAAYAVTLRELGKRPQVYAKFTEIFHRIEDSGGPGGSGGRIPHELSFYRPRLDELYEVFGPDRLIFGSDWTTSEEMGTFAETLNVVREYFSSKEKDIAERFFWKNSVAAYRWVKRRTDQPRV